MCPHSGIRQLRLEIPLHTKLNYCGFSTMYQTFVSNLPFSSGCCSIPHDLSRSGRSSGDAWLPQHHPSDIEFVRSCAYRFRGFDSADSNVRDMSGRPGRLVRAGRLWNQSGSAAGEAASLSRRGGQACAVYYFRMLGFRTPRCSRFTGRLSGGDALGRLRAIGNLPQRHWSPRKGGYRSQSLHWWRGNCRD